MKTYSISMYIIFIVLLLGTGVPGYSATFTVTNSNDDGEGSLRQAVYEADTNGEDDTIIIPAGIHIVFESSGSAVKSLEINSNISIRGAGADTVSIDGNNVDRVFLIHGGNVNISGITIKNGRADGDGGGIRVEGGTVTLTGCTVTGCYESTETNGALTTGGGGGIYIKDAGATITNCTISDNESNAGSRSTSVSGGGGGGIFAENASVTITGCTVTGNTVRDFYDSEAVLACGGGIHVRYSDAVITQSVISGNTAKTFKSWGTSVRGGGIYSAESGITVTGCTLSTNESKQGGGICIMNLDNVDKRIEIQGNTITENSINVGSGYGGGLYLKAGTPGNYPVVSDNTFEGNIAGTSDGGYGGAMYLVRYAAVTGNLFQNNHANKGYPAWGYGGAVFLYDVLGADFDANRFIGNTASEGNIGFGGGIYAEFNAVFTMTNNLFADNLASYRGNAVALGIPSCNSVRCTMTNNTFVNNGSDSGAGCISVGPNVELTMKNNIITGCGQGINTPFSSSGTILSLDTNLFWNDSNPLTGIGAIFADPLLTENYKPVERSPAVDAGLPIDGLTEDIDGTRRPLGNGYDIGAYEFDPAAPPAISVSRTVFNFAGKAIYTTPAQTFLISNTGGGTLHWTAAPDAGWITVNPSAGTDSGLVTIGVDTAGLAAGTYTGTVSISDASASNSPRTVSVNLVIYRPTAIAIPPFGRFSTPVDGSTVRGSIPVTGWALDDIGVETVKIYRDEGIYIGDAVFVEGARPDVEETYPDYPLNTTAGWGYMLLTNFLPNNGNGTFTIYAEAEDKEGNTISLGTKTITCDNANAVKPFGAVDTPAQGGTASGGSYRNYGWVLTPQPNEIPRDGSTLHVYVDGKLLGNPVYNIYREDIADLFPGYANSDGAVGYFSLDTTGYADGVHTIFWTAEDDAGNTGGIGSRYFTIRNLAGSMGQGAWKSGGQRTEDEKKRLLRVAGCELRGKEERRGRPDDHGPIDVITGFNGDANSQRFYPDVNGDITVNTRELERVEIRFPGPVSNLSALPVGSTLDRERGIFYWQPGSGFSGEYRFRFGTRGLNGEPGTKRLTIIIQPKFK